MRGTLSKRLSSPGGRIPGGFPKFFALPEDVQFHFLHFIQSQDLLSFACCSTSLKLRVREMLRNTFLVWFDIYPERVSMKKIFWAVHRIHHMTKRRAVELLHFSSARNYPKFVAWFLDSYLPKVAPSKPKNTQRSSSSSSRAHRVTNPAHSPGANGSRNSEPSAPSSTRAPAPQAAGNAQNTTLGSTNTTNSTSSSLVNATSGSESMTALHYAAGNSSISCLKLLLASKPIDVNRVAKSSHSGGNGSGFCGRTAAHFAADQCHAEALSMIVDHPSWNPDVRDGGGRTVLFCVSSMGMNELVGKLLEKKVATTVTDRSGKTALYAAAESGFADVCHTLLEETKVDVLQSATTGKSPLYAASENGHHEAADVLLSHGADIRQETFREKIPLYAAAEQGHAKVVKVLLKYTKQADLFKLNRYGTTPMFIASKQANKAVKNLFLKFCLKKSQQKAERRAEKQKQKQLKRHRSAPPGRRRGRGGGPKSILANQKHARAATKSKSPESVLDASNKADEESNSPHRPSAESPGKLLDDNTANQKREGVRQQQKKVRPKSRKQSARAGVPRGRPQTRGGSPHVKFSQSRRPSPDSSTDDASSSCSNPPSSQSGRSELDEFDHEVELIHARARTKGLRIVTPRYLEDLNEFTQQSTKQRARLSMSRAAAATSAARSESQTANEDNGDAKSPSLGGSRCSRARIRSSHQKARQHNPYRPTGAPRAAAAAAVRRFGATTAAPMQRVVKASGERSAMGVLRSDERPTSCSTDTPSSSDEPSQQTDRESLATDAAAGNKPRSDAETESLPSAFGAPREAAAHSDTNTSDPEEFVRGASVSAAKRDVPSAFGVSCEASTHLSDIEAGDAEEFAHEASVSVAEGDNPPGSACRVDDLSEPCVAATLTPKYEYISTSYGKIAYSSSSRTHSAPRHSSGTRSLQTLQGPSLCRHANYLLDTERGSDVPSAFDSVNVLVHQRALTERKAPTNDSSKEHAGVHQPRPQSALSLRASSRLLRKLAQPLPPLSQRTKLVAITTPPLRGVPSGTGADSVALGLISTNLNSSRSLRPLTSPHSLPARIPPLSTFAPFTTDQQRSTFRNSRVSTTESENTLPKQTHYDPQSGRSVMSAGESGGGAALKSERSEDSPKLLKRLSSSSKLMIAKVPPKSAKETNVMEICASPTHGKAKRSTGPSTDDLSSPHRVSPREAHHSPNANKRSSSVDADIAEGISSKPRRDPAASAHRIHASQRNPSKGPSKRDQRVPRLSNVAAQATKASAQPSPRAKKRETNGPKQHNQHHQRKTRRSPRKTPNDGGRLPSGSPDSKSILSPMSKSSRAASQMASRTENDFLLRQNQFAQKVKSNRERREQTAFEEVTSKKSRQPKKGRRRSSMLKSQRRLEKIRSIYDSPLPRRRTSVSSNRGAPIPMVREDEVEFVDSHAMVPLTSMVSDARNPQNVFARTTDADDAPSVRNSARSFSSSTHQPHLEDGARGRFGTDRSISRASHDLFTGLRASVGNTSAPPGYGLAAQRGVERNSARRMLALDNFNRIRETETTSSSTYRSSKSRDPHAYSPNDPLDSDSPTWRRSSKSRNNSFLSGQYLDGAATNPLFHPQHSQRSSKLSFSESKAQSRLHDERSVAARAGQRLRREHLNRTRRVYSQNTRSSHERKRCDSRKTVFSSLDSAAGSDSAAAGGQEEDTSSVRSVGRLKPLLAARRRIGFLSYSQTRKLIKNHQKYRAPPASTHASLLPDLMSGASSRPLSRTRSRAGTSAESRRASRHGNRAPDMSKGNEDLSEQFDFLRVSSVTPMSSACHSPAQLRSQSGRLTNTPKPRDFNELHAGAKAEVDTLSLGTGRYSPLGMDKGNQYSTSLVGTPQRIRPSSCLH